MSEADLSVIDGYAKWAVHYDDGFNPLIELEKDCLASFNLPFHSARVLDLASGTGRHALHFAKQGAAVTAIDASPAMLQIAEEKRLDQRLHNLKLIEAMIDKPLPIDRESIDFAICSLALCHVSDLRQVFRSVFEALNAGGMFVVTDLHPSATAAGFGVLFQHGDRLRSIASVTHAPDSYETELEDAGFIVSVVEERPLGMAFKKEPSDLPDAVRNTNWRDLPFCLAIAAKKAINSGSAHRLYR